MTRTIGLLLLVLFAVSCSSIGVRKEILGEWQCISWKAMNSDEERCISNNIYLRFMENKTYVSVINSNIDSGTFKIVDGNLYMEPKNKMKIAMHLIRLDSIMVLQMNNGGIEERMALGKVNVDE